MNFLKLAEGEGVVCMSCRRRTKDNAIADDGVGLCRRCYDALMKKRVKDYYDVGGDLQRLFATFRYEGKIKQMVHKMKFAGESAYAVPLARLLYEALPPYYDFSCFDMIIPVPLYKARLEERGFNQAELIAEELSERMGIPLAKGVLSRVRETKRQMYLSRTMRLANVRGAFSATKDVKDRNILLVDDIYTVGATAKECADELKRQGAGRVNAIVLCTNFNMGCYERPPTIPAIKKAKNYAV